MLKLKSSGFLLFASLIVMAQGSAWGQQDPAFLPEIQVDGSVLQSLAAPSPTEASPQNLAPVQLIAPSLTRIAAPATGSLTRVESGLADQPSEESIKPVITVTAAPVKTIVAPPAKSPTPLPLPVRKPQIANADKMVVFPIKAQTKTMGDLNPSSAQTISAPVQPESTTSAALALSMTQRDVPAETQSPAKQLASWWQENPKILYRNVPVPKPRPVIGMASASFVKQARNNLVDTYTIVKREGDKMPAVPRQKVAGEKLPAPRLSIADIASDPLASRIVDMSPEEVAHALNAMTPASGTEKLSRELSTIAKPRIVRVEGEWIRKDGKGNRQQEDLSQISKTTVSADDGERVAAVDSGLLLPPKTPAARIPDVKPAPTPAVLELASLPQEQPLAGTISVNFKAGEVSLTGDATGTIDNHVVEALKKSPDSRIQIVAYAVAADGKEGTARRTSLSRALSVRSYLISQGIDATRMDVRAMGMQTDKTAATDKVDMILMTGKKS